MRTWDDNRTAINQLWPMAQFTDEEKRLWSEDLSRLDQVVLYDSIRNVKRTHDSLYPQLPWVLNEYRGLARVQKLAERRPVEQRAERVRIDKHTDRQTHDELKVVVEMATRETFEETRDLIAQKAHDLKVEMATAYALCRYLLRRLGMARGNALGGEA